MVAGVKWVVLYWVCWRASWLVGVLSCYMASSYEMLHRDLHYQTICDSTETSSTPENVRNFRGAAHYFQRHTYASLALYLAAHTCLLMSMHHLSSSISFYTCHPLQGGVPKCLKLKKRKEKMALGFATSEKCVK